MKSWRQVCALTLILAAILAPQSSLKGYEPESEDYRQEGCVGYWALLDSILNVSESVKPKKLTRQGHTFLASGAIVAAHYEGENLRAVQVDSARWRLSDLAFPDVATEPSDEKELLNQDGWTVIEAYSIGERYFLFDLYYANCAGSFCRNSRYVLIDPESKKGFLLSNYNMSAQNSFWTCSANGEEGLFYVSSRFSLSDPLKIEYHLHTYDGKQFAPCMNRDESERCFILAYCGHHASFQKARLIESNWTE